ncbi:MAG: hypothetical protein RML56_02735 [Burkholderiales bacterium]|nr:hypothetical protein [Burkholderiales bacterium]
MALLDADRFEGRFRDGVHQVDTSDLMRRMVKESLVKFDGTPLFPERIAYTVPYKLSSAEARLYKEVTEYVREEFNRAEALASEKRAGTVGFALTILQRRLASSPEAIYQSLRRRRERLERRLRELELLQRGGAAPLPVPAGPVLDADDVEDLEEAPENEVQAAEEDVLDQATAASTIAEAEARDRNTCSGSRRSPPTCAAAARTPSGENSRSFFRRSLRRERSRPASPNRPPTPPPPSPGPSLRRARSS